MNSDRNLLFGILALQMDFISRDQLVSAMSAWVLDKSKPLEDILEEQQALSGEARGVLTPLVEMHIKHHGDATQSLAVLSSVGSIKHALETLGDADVEASIGQLDDGMPESLGSSTQSYDGSGDPVRYQILRPHAKGGLGQVSVARDTELNREVALKEIQEQYADHPESRSRFVVEAEITGGLEHPGIVPVYGLGHYEDGRPYYAMRFIKGDSLKQAADEYHKNKSADASERSLQLRKLLGRFVDVCNAIEYAHSRGVLHRDLKPGNIMLGRYGETLVVDWGLAKPVGRSDKDSYPDEQTLKPSSGSGSAPTQLGKAIGTPNYMSPEQAEGRLDELGMASDVYSLGATLYYVLSGKAPITGDSKHDVIEKARRGESTPLLEVDPAIPKPLNAICMRALAKDPKQRYASPQVLADDVDRFLADEPIKSFVEPMAVRTRRWMRKHPKTIASMPATLLVGLTSTLIIATVVSGKNLELATKNSEMDDKNLQLANANQELNETNEALVIANAKEIAAREEAERQQQIAQSVRDFLQKDLLQQADVSEQADRLLAIGGRQFQTEQNPSVRELLDRAAAETTSDKIEEKFPNQPFVQAEILQTLGLCYQGIGEYEAAVAHLKRSKELTALVSGHSPLDLLTVMNNLAVAYHYAGKLESARALCETTFELSKEILGDDHTDTLDRMSNLGSFYLEAGNTRKALELLSKVLELRKGHYGDDHRKTLRAMNGLAVAYISVGKNRDALKLLKATMEKLQLALGPDHPETILSMRNLAGAYRSVGDPTKALELLEEAFDKSKTILGPTHPETLGVMNNLGEIYLSIGQLSLAVPLLEDTLKKRRAVLGTDHIDTLGSMNNLAIAYVSIGRVNQALPVLETILERTRIILGDDHPNTLKTMANLAGSYLAMGKLNEALTLLEETCEKARETMGDDHPQTLESMNALATTYWRMKKLDQSIPLFEKTVKKMETKLGSTHPNTLVTKANLGVNYYDAGRLEEAINLVREVVPYSDKYESLHWVPRTLLEIYIRADKLSSGIAIVESMIQSSRTTSAPQSLEIANQLHVCASYMIQLKNLKAAESILQECLAIREKNIPDSWLVFNTKSVLGAALLGQAKASLETDGNTAPAKFTEAEQLLLNGYNGMKKREATISERVRNTRLTEALERLVDLYTTWDKPDEAAKWQAELDKRKAKSEKTSTESNAENNPAKDEANGESK